MVYCQSGSQRTTSLLVRSLRCCAMVLPLTFAPHFSAVAQEACTATGNTLSAAVKAYGNSCSVARKDCDPVDGGWMCSSQTIGSSSPSGAAPPPSPNSNPPQPPAPNPEPPTPTPAPPTTNPEPHTPPGHNHPVPVSQLPKGSNGTGALALSNRSRTSRTPSFPNVASFRTDCEFSHMNYDDAILSPGQPGQAHLHQYFGNTDVDAFSTDNTVITSGNSTCAGGVANRSAYWTPALIDVRSNTAVKPDGATIYYKTGWDGGYPANTVAPPNGLRVIAGDASESGPQGGSIYNSNTDWFCIAPSNNFAGPFNLTEGMPTDCRNGDILRMRVNFPNCWDGRNLDSVDHKRHMAYSKGDHRNRGGCPGSHPVQIRTMTVNADWVVKNAADVKHWRLSSDMYSRSIRAGYSAHADWIVGWDQTIFNRILEGCYRPAQDCGHNNLNDGQGLRLVK